MSRPLCLTLALCASLIASAIGAETVRLSGGGGSVDGELLGYDGHIYRVMTDAGELSVDAAHVTCEGEACPTSDFVPSLSFSGYAPLARDLMPPLIADFARRQGYTTETEAQNERDIRITLSDDAPRFRFRIHAATTDEGVADLLADEADIVLAGRALNATEGALLGGAGLGNPRDAARLRVLATDGLVPVVARGHPQSAISLDDLTQVLSGEISDWRGLGNQAGPISLHLPSRLGPLVQALAQGIMAGRDFAPEARWHDSAEAVADAVEADPLAIGITWFTDLAPTVTPLRVTGACGFGGEASRLGLQTGDYPLTTPVMLYLPARRLSDLALEFLRYLRDPSAQAIIRRAGFIDQRLTQVPLAEQGERLSRAILQAETPAKQRRLRALVQRIETADRLSTTLRFEDGALDAMSVSAVNQLASAMQSGQFDGRLLHVVGFSDSTDARAEENARVVYDAIRRIVGDETLRKGGLSRASFGDALPIACNDSPSGRRANNRVELWLE